MAVTYSTAVKTARMQAVANTLDAGAGSAVLEIGTAGMAAVLASFTLPEPCGTVAGVVLTLDFDPDIAATASGSGTAAAAQIKDGSGVVQITGLTVGTSGADVILDSVSITSGQTVTLTSGTLSHA